MGWETQVLKTIGSKMSEAGKIYADPSQPAKLQYGTKSIDCPTLQEAVLAFERLSEKDRGEAIIRVNVPGGATYTAKQIAQLHIPPKKT